MAKTSEGGAASAEQLQGLRAAIMADDADTVRALLEAGAPAKAPWAPVVLAARRGNLAIVRALLDAGAGIEEADSDGTRALHAACATKRVDIVRLLLDRSARPNAVDKLKQTPLVLAASFHKPGRARLMPLSTAIGKLLLDAGADPSRVPKNGTTALLAAIEHRNDALVELLRQHGADVSDTDVGGRDGLMLAYTSGAADTFEKLLRAGARRDRKNDEGWSIADVVQGDGYVPAELDVHLRCSAEPQTVRVRVEFVPDQGILGTDIRNCFDRLAKMSEGGVLGSDVFAPATGRGALRMGTKRPAKKGKNPFESIEARFTLAGASPAGIALWIRAVTTSYSNHVRRLDVVGSHPLDRSPLSVDAERVATWLRDPSLEPIEPWPGARAVIRDAPSNDCVFRIQLEGRGGKGFRAFWGAMNSATRSLIPPHESAREWLAMRLGGCPGSLYVSFKEPDAKGWIIGKARDRPCVEAAGPDDRAELRALFVNALERMAESETVLVAEWSLRGRAKRQVRG